MNKDCVYILFSEKLDRFYIGSTSDFDVRMDFHRNSEARKFTAKADDWVIFDKINCESNKQALSIEKHIKSMKSRIYIKNIKLYPEMKDKLKAKFK
ncbi:GIY-YIG nuclease family protein [Gillisia limnaea]|uniref:Excinuclease ABC C subunit domain protein n=1 Tax=Gillisia limnaea (strain DSM 15749 / LMG 21470 / R-8282) TaxID=865937 RepID=H2BVG7_GILLR|nr:GIY-YIG nuclease family protein [Gillisia limnaea]EHQ02875.1 Excinuclease ABC C subunit domain protein [Gillisia limnaea DSM 15749]